MFLSNDPVQNRSFESNVGDVLSNRRVWQPCVTWTHNLTIHYEDGSGTSLRIDLYILQEPGHFVCDLQ